MKYIGTYSNDADIATKANVDAKQDKVLVNGILKGDGQGAISAAETQEVELVTLTKVDVGLGNVANERQYSSKNPPPYPVTSVNGKTGAVTVSSVNVPSTTSLIKGNGSGGLVAATRGSDYIASGNITKQTLVASESTPTENYAINWVYG